jgi:hypothetical protein
MEVKTFIYEKMLNSFYLMSWLGKEKMDDHIAKMLTDGWQIVSQLPGKKPAKGIGLPGDIITTVYKRE